MTDKDKTCKSQCMMTSSMMEGKRLMLSHPSDYIIDDGIRFKVNFTKNRVDYQELHLVSEMEFKGTKIDERIYLTHSEVAKGKKDLIRQRLNEGVKPKDIEAELSVGKSYIYRIKREGN